ncbi:hypothetical protein ACHAW6_005333 [Cyclotella cf. meneghiniana]
MGIKQDIKDILKKFNITNIDGQPTDKDMNQLNWELGAMLATVPTTNCGGDHGHIGMILDDSEYTSFSTGSIFFIVPKNPGSFSSIVITNEVDHLRQLSEPKQSIIEYETYKGCLQATRTKIIQAIDPKWLGGLCREHLGFTHCTPIKILNHLCSNSATLENINIRELIKQQLEKVGIHADPHHCLALFKATVKHTGTLDPAIQEWEAKPKSNQTFTKFCPFIVREFFKNNTRKLTAQAAGFGNANHTVTVIPFTHDTTNLVLATTAELVNAVSAKNNKNWTTSSNSRW